MRKGRRIFWKAASGVIDTIKIWSGICLAMALALATVMAAASVVVANEHRAEASTAGQAASQPAAGAPQTAVPETKDAPPTVEKELTKREQWPPQSILLGILLAGAGLGAMIFGARHVRRVHRTHWWDRSMKEPNGHLDWDDVRKLMRQYPVHFQSRWRPCWMFLLWEIPLALGLGSAIWASGQLVTNSDINAENVEHVGVGIGGLGIFLAFLGVLHTNRVSTRSTNRQAWINGLRSELAAIVEALPRHDSADEIMKIRDEVREGRTKVELMLNPSEKDHRALVTLIRHFFAYEDIGIDQEARRELGLRPAELNCPKTRMRRKSQLIRLANAVLKREWEQVKHAR